VNDRLKALAGSRRLRLPSSASATAQAVHSKLALQSGRTFDQFYIRDQIDVHEELLELINKEISSGKDARAQAFAQDILATVQTHLKLVRVLAASEGV
jgi:predicted outer membrane protein